MPRYSRTASGSAVTEFGPALILLVCFVLLPILNIAFVPIYWFAASASLDQFTHKLSLAEKRSDAYFQLANDSGWRDLLRRFGVTLHNPHLALIACDPAGSEKIAITAGQAVPDNWLPGGAKSPCVYSLQLSVQADIPPVCPRAAGLPGFSTPITITLCSHSQWENVGRDPATGQYYLNE
jgi:hypothetical protein